MKRFIDLTDQELVALTEESVQYYIDLACAEQGVPLRPQPPGLLSPAPEVPTAVMYGFGSLWFETQQAALDVLDTVAKYQLYADHGYDLSSRFEPIDPGTYSYPTISTRTQPLQEDYERYAADIQQYSVLKEAWKNATQEYTRAKDTYDKAAYPILSKISNAKQRQQELVNMCNIFEKYLTLANDDKSVAWNFFINAYPNDAYDEELMAMLGLR
jgi:hypothetical protein